MLNCFLLITKTRFLTSIPIYFSQIILDEDHPHLTTLGVLDRLTNINLHTKWSHADHLSSIKALQNWMFKGVDPITD